MERLKDNLFNSATKVFLNQKLFLPHGPNYIYSGIAKAILVKEDVTVGEGSG